MGFLSKVWKEVRGTLGAVTSGIGKGISSIPVVGDLLGDPLESIGNKMVADDNASKAYEAAQKQLTAEQQFNAEQAELNRLFQRNERLESQEFNIDMWNMNNEYNSPVEQLKRAQAAGINPNALFANGVHGSGSASPVETSPMSGTPTAASPSIADSILTHDAMLQQMMAQTELTRAQAESQKYDLSWNKLTEKERYRNLVAQSDKIFSDIGMNEFTKDQQRTLLRFTAAKTNAEIKVMCEQLNLLRNQSLDILKGIEVKDSQIRLNNTQSNLNVANINKTNLESAQIKEETNYIKEQVEYQDLENQIKTLEVAVSQATGAPVGTDEHTMMFYMFKTGQYEDYFNYCADNAVKDSYVSKEIMGGARVIQSIFTSLFGNTAQPSVNYRNPR